MPPLTPLMSRMQVLSPSAPFIVLQLAILFLTYAQRVGARSGKDFPCSHLLLQKRVMLPSPTIDVIKMENRANAFGCTWILRWRTEQMHWMHLGI